MKQLVISLICAVALSAFLLPGALSSDPLPVPPGIGEQTVSDSRHQPMAPSRTVAHSSSERLDGRSLADPANGDHAQLGHAGGDGADEALATLDARQASEDPAAQEPNADLLASVHRSAHAGCAHCAGGQIPHEHAADDARAAAEAGARADERFRAWARDFLQAGAENADDATIQEGAALAAQRRAALRQLIIADPQRALGLAVDAELATRLPLPVRGLLESQLATAGRYDILCVLNEDRAEETAWFTTDDERIYNAHTFGANDRLQPQDRIFLSGIAIDEEFAVAQVDGDDGSRGDGGSGSDDGEVAAATTSDAWTTGPKTFLFIRLRFADQDPSFEPQSLTSSNAELSKTSDFFKANSYGQTWLSSWTVTPVYTLPQTAQWYTDQGSAGLDRVRSDGLALAKAAGYDANAFSWNTVRYAGGPGSFAGMAYIRNRGMWLKNGSAWVICHELGHNYGAWHANLWKSSTIIGSGSLGEYGNPFCMMGNKARPPSGHFSANFKWHFTWLFDAHRHNVGSSSSGTYRIYAHDGETSLSSSRAYGMRVFANVTASDGLAGLDYWVEARQLETSSNLDINNGVQLSWGTETRVKNSQRLLDLRPATTAADAPIRMGETFSDMERDIHITPIVRYSTTPVSYDVVVKRGTAASNKAPKVTLAADRSTAATLETVKFSASASDPDGDSQLGYTWTFGDGSFSTASSALQSKAWKTAGDYTVTVTVSDLKGGKATASTIITVGSTTTTNTPPVIAQGSSVPVTMSEDGKPTAFALTLNASDADGDALSWSISTAPSNGTASVGASGTSVAVSYAPKVNYNGSDSFAVRVADGKGGTDSIAVNVSIQPVNDAPVASNDSASTTKDTAVTISVLANDSDVDGDALIITKVGAPSSGSAVINSGGTITYMPATGFTGTASFTYTISDGALSASATVSVSVTESSTGSGSLALLVDFGASADRNAFGLAGWTTVIKDKYTGYAALGPGGTTITGGSNGSYNYQGVTSAAARSFASGEKIVVHWYNAGSTTISFTPRLSFNDPDRVGSGSSGTWYSMSAGSVPAGGTATTELLIDSAKAGSYALVNLNCNYSNTQRLICDKIVLVGVSGPDDGPSGEPPPPVNALINPGFEDGATGWSGVSGAAAIVSSPVHAGKAALQIIASSGSAKKVTQTAAARGGQTYAIGGWVRTLNLASKARVSVTWRNAGGSAIGSVTIMDLNLSAWTEASARLIAPLDAVSAQLVLYVPQEADNSGSAWFDDFVFAAVDPKPESALAALNNLVGNPGFEAGISPWGSVKGLAAIVTTQAHTGKHSLQMTASSASGKTVSQKVAVSGGTAYDIEAWVKTANLTGKAKIAITWRDASGSSLGTVTIMQLNPGTWTRVASTITAPFDAASANVYLSIPVEADNQGAAWFDDILVAPIGDGLFIGDAGDEPERLRANT